MRITRYHISGPVKGLWKQSAIVGSSGVYSSPLVYLQRPKWIKDDEVWKKIVESIQLNLPVDLEVR